MAEAFSPFVLPAADCHRPKTDSFLLDIQNFLSIQKLHADCIEGLAAIPVGPPQQGMFDHNLLRAVLIKSFLPIRSGQHYPVPKGIPFSFHLCAEKKLHPFSLMLLTDGNLLPSRTINTKKLYRPENSGIGKPRSPVPSEHAVRLPQSGAAPHGVRAV